MEEQGERGGERGRTFTVSSISTENQRSNDKKEYIEMKRELTLTLSRTTRGL